MTRFQLIYNRLRGQLWFRPALWTVSAVAAALVAQVADQLVPAELVPGIDSDTLNRLLDIVASSMLTVSIFSLSILVSAFAAAASGATPRAVYLMTADADAQTPLATFIAGFVYAVVAITALGSGYYDKVGRLVMFVATLVMLAYIIFVFLRWIHIISRLGRMGYTIERIEVTALRSLRRYWAAPLMGGVPIPFDDQPGVPVHLPHTGYLQVVDIEALQKLAADADARVQVLMRPGAYVHPAEPVARLVGVSSPDADLLRDLADAFVVGRERTHEADPRYGLIILGEIAQRALSPAVNDPGTAIAVLGSLTRVMVDSRTEGDAPSLSVLADGSATRVCVVDLPVDTLVTDAFDAVARDGASMLEVGVRLLKSLHVVIMNNSPEIADAARAQIWRSVERARHAGAEPGDLALLERLAHEFAGAPTTAAGTS